MKNSVKDMTPLYIYFNPFKFKRAGIVYEMCEYRWTHTLSDV